MRRNAQVQSTTLLRLDDREVSQGECDESSGPASGIPSKSGSVFGQRQHEDIFRVLEQTELGRRTQVLTLTGQLLEGAAAAGKLMAGLKACEIPLPLLGNSRRSMATGWAMTKNCAGGCNYDMPVVRFRSPKGHPNIKGAMLLRRSSAARAICCGRQIWPIGTCSSAAQQPTPTSPSFQLRPARPPMHRWPSVFFAKGLWDRAESLEGTIAPYDRVQGLKEIVVSRGPALV